MQTWMRRTWMWGGTALLALAGPAAAAPTVTGTSGARSADGELGLRQALESGATLETEEEGGCAVLMDDTALMEMCGSTTVRLEREGEGPNVVRLDQGEIRLVVEPKLGEVRVEIHTPAAIATLLGTIVHASVDTLGVTTITSAASKVLVQSSDPNVGGRTTIDGGQRLVIQPGQPVPQRPARVGAQEVAALGGCLIDFHELSLAQDREAHESDEVEDALAEDILEGDLPQVAAAVGAVNVLVDQIEQQLGGGGPGPVDPGDLLDPIDGAINPMDLIDDIIDQVPDPGGACPPGLPGEACDF